jgi:peptidoglycan hydrolase-like protein with peptidoglycan-binding domain
MRRSVQRWLFCGGVVAAVGASAALQAGAASAAQVTQTASNARAARAATAAYVPPTTNLYYGDRGPAVRSVQRRLNQLGYYAGAADGQYGQNLEEAVWAFKEVQGLPMNADTNSVITRAFRRDLINPRPPRVLVHYGAPSRVEINQNIQVLVLYRDNAPFLILHVSTGGGYTYPCPGDPAATCGPAITPDGNYTANWFYRGWLTVPLGTMYNPVFFKGNDYAIHGDIPVPWYPASHGCVRIWMDVAPWFHTLLRVDGEHGTQIYIRGTAPYYL